MNYRDQAFTSTQKVVTVFLQKSKMDPFCQGHTIKIYATEQHPPALHYRAINHITNS